MLPLCRACVTKRPIPGGGRTRGHPCMLVGEGPGIREHEEGECFIGPTGSEYDGLYLPISGLSRRDVYTTNAYKCFLQRDIQPGELRICANRHLRQEIATIRPDIVVLMGGRACSLASSISLDVDHGRPQNVILFGRRQWVFPTFHPALGEHDRPMMRQIMQDFSDLGAYLDGELHIPTDSYHEPDYRQINSTDLVRLSRGASWMSLDSEALGLDPFNDEPFSLQVSFKEGTGYFIHADDTRSLLELSYIVEDLPSFIHNIPFDIPIASRMGIEFDLDSVTDTMMSAFHRDMPQGLKALGLRECGVHMDEFEDMIAPAGEAVAVSWLEEASRWQYRPGEGLKHGLNRRIDSILSAVEKNGIRRTNPRKRWKNMDVPAEMKQQAERVLGPMPQADISLIDEKMAIEYACRDADIGGRVGQIMKMVTKPFLYE